MDNLAVDAYRASGCKTHAEFIALFGGAIGLRTFRDWLAGKVIPPLAQLVLREFLAGWRPGVAMRQVPAVAAFLAEAENVASDVGAAGSEWNVGQAEWDATEARQKVVEDVTAYLNR